MQQPLLDTADLEEVHEIAIEVLDSVGLMADGEALVPPSTWPDKGFHASVAIIGSDPGQLQIWADAGTAVALTGLLTDRPVAELELADGQDSISELANLLAGTAKSVFPGENRLAEPVAQQIEAADIPQPGDGHVEIVHDLGRFIVQLLTESN